MTTRAYQSSCVIDAAPDAVWALLVDAPGYATWDNGVVRVDGAIAAGERITVYSEADPKRAFPVTVTELAPAERMVWRGGMPLGSFVGERVFTLTPTDSGGTAFTMREEYTGVLAPLIWRAMPNLGPSFTKFARGLKARAEPPRPFDPDEPTLS